MATRPVTKIRAVPETKPLEATGALYPFLLKRKRTHFVLLHPRNVQPIPQLVIGIFQAGNPPSLSGTPFDLQKSSVSPDMWEIKATDCNLEEGQVYHYWFRLRDGHPQSDRTATLDCYRSDGRDRRLAAAIGQTAALASVHG